MLAHQCCEDDDLHRLQIYEIPFFVALDHQREAVLVAVRGTLSLKVNQIKLKRVFLVDCAVRSFVCDQGSLLTG